MDHRRKLLDVINQEQTERVSWNDSQAELGHVYSVVKLENTPRRDIFELYTSDKGRPEIFIITIISSEFKNLISIENTCQSVFLYSVVNAKVGNTSVSYMQGLGEYLSLF
jgi:hypothetical protein